MSGRLARRQAESVVAAIIGHNVSDAVRYALMFRWVGYLYRATLCPV